MEIIKNDGFVTYYGKVTNREAADKYLEILLTTIDWKNDEAKIFGRHIVTKRKVAWYGDHSYAYKYSGTTKEALKWTPELLQLKQLTERLTGEIFNSCLLNLYHDGSEGMGWHSDDEKSLAKDSAIASLSFGAERKFTLKHRLTKENYSLLLEHGSLLMMKGATQTHWLHALPKSARATTPRINLTFRKMMG